jgi:hypothetical protein
MTEAQKGWIGSPLDDFLELRAVGAIGLSAAH